MNDAYEGWVEQARYDLETAEAMQKAGRWLYVLFCCQQSVEKMLKAIISRKTKQLPPRIHNLMRLAELAGLTLSEERITLLRKLTAYYLQSRYPEEIADLRRSATPEMAKKIFEQTGEMVQWLTSV